MNNSLSPDQPRSDQIPTFTYLFSTSWAIYQRRVGTLLAIMFISLAIVLGIVMVVGAVAVGLFFAMRPWKNAIIGIAVILVGLPSFYVLVRFHLALVIALLREEATVKEAVAASRNRLWFFVGLGILNALILIGGFILLIIPGVIFAVWFAFASFIFVAEGRTAVQSLSASKVLIKGKWWDVAARLFVLGLVTSLLSMIPLVGWLFSILLSPFGGIYTVTLYRSLRASAPAIAV